MIILRSVALEAHIDEKRGACITRIGKSKDADNFIYLDHEKRLLRQPGRPYDDVWAGGFEELFPNDEPCIFEGRELPDHGELWNAEWKVSSHSDLSATLQYVCQTVPAAIEKNIIIDSRMASLAVDYRITNLSSQSFHYLFKLHPAMMVSAGDEILLPGGSVIPVDLNFSSILGSPGPFSWPIVRNKEGHEHDLRFIPERSSRLKEFVYVVNLSDGWCGIRKHQTGEVIRFTFPLASFPYCWLFLSYGGWRDHYTVVLEPCSNYPKKLTEAVAAGRCAILRGHESRRFRAEITIS